MTIARVRVHSTRPAEFLHDGQIRSCGQIYSAEVRESLKGSSSPIEFLALDPSPFTGVNRDYLVFAIESHPESAERLMADWFEDMSSLDRGTQLCQIRAARHFIKDMQKLWFAFEPKPQQRGDYLIVQDLVLFAECSRPQAEPPRESSAARPITWQCARRVIQEQLRP